MSPYDNAVLVEYGGRKWWGCCLATWVLFSDDAPAFHAMTVAGVALLTEVAVPTAVIWRTSSRAAAQRLMVTHLFDAATVDEHVPRGMVHHPNRWNPEMMPAFTLSAAVAAWYEEHKQAKRTFDELASRSGSVATDEIKAVLARFVKMPNTQATRDQIKAAVERLLGVPVTVNFDANGNVVIT